MKTFFWRDKSGRGGTATIEESNMWYNDETDVNWNGDLLSEWVETAEEGDVWENATDYYICIKS